MGAQQAVSQQTWAKILGLVFADIVCGSTNLGRRQQLGNALIAENGMTNSYLLACLQIVNDLQYYIAISN